MKFLLLLIVSSIAMIVMHSLSTLIGAAFTLIVPKLWTQIITIILFWGMGIWAIYQAIKKLCCKKKGDDSSSEDEEAELKAAVAENEAEYKQA